MEMVKFYVCNTRELGETIEFLYNSWIIKDMSSFKIECLQNLICLGDLKGVFKISFEITDSLEKEILENNTF